ncbi:CDP-diacylglycerol--serine O-phosphatidyltransferase [Thorsellia anophelis]|uniref:CDP-diacylglycerol---serine O-phosphatidyltransferase n=1 Tax=Thorsellia anophelis DSM 18579 TaxID=1123402 RepID=A0A1I0BMU9_9GAMM|nr:CDP-diacylglycerol--serine O-phosphatidyltransferase [Thorsellia anophelis]SET07591.1 CDP-diacylglycerol---serine O-phosphatidyltransferase [Thorsellia anophelis DSM 18579]
MLSFFSREDALFCIEKLPKATLDKSAISFYNSPKHYSEELFKQIAQAKTRIYLVALYFENDEAGQKVIDALYQAKKNQPQLEVKIFVDWHRAQRGRIGESETLTNADWYSKIRDKMTPLNIEFYGVPINTREALGVLHFKGAVFDDNILFTGASINNVYLHHLDKYRFDRYHLIKSKNLSDSFVCFIEKKLLPEIAVKRLDSLVRPKTQEFKKSIKQLRKKLMDAAFELEGETDSDASIIDPITVTPIVGLGNKNAFNKLIGQLLIVAEKDIVICTPYFNLPTLITKILRQMLKKGVKVKIVIGDKTANDFYIPETEPFRAIGGLPYLYELNLKKFMKSNQKFIDKDLLSINLWKDGDNTYHLKGVWIDEEWMLITGNNLNPRAWRLDLENGLLIRDKEKFLIEKKHQELSNILTNTTQVAHHSNLDTIDNYPLKVKKLIRRVKRLRLDKIINRIL